MSLEEKANREKLKEKKIQFQIEDHSNSKKADTVKKVIKGANKAWTQLNKA